MAPNPAKPQRCASSVSRGRRAQLVATNTALSQQLTKTHQGVTALAGGGGGRGGQGVMAASYAFQDFTSQINNGIVPALGAVHANNIPGILIGLGVGGTVSAGLSVCDRSGGACRGELGQALTGIRFRLSDRRRRDEGACRPDDTDG